MEPIKHINYLIGSSVYLCGVVTVIQESLHSARQQAARVTDLFDGPIVQ
jgi:hypothetical protein